MEITQAGEIKNNSNLLSNTPNIYIYIYIYIYTYSALHKYWDSKDKIALLAVESRHLQIWLKDEYETKVQNVIFYY